MNRERLLVGTLKRGLIKHSNGEETGDLLNFHLIYT